MPLSQKIFALGFLFAAMPSLWWLLKSWLLGSYDTAGIWGGISLLVLLIWSLSSDKLSCRKANKSIVFSLFATAAILQFSDIGINANILSGLSLGLDVYALGLWMGLRYRKRPLAPEWLIILFIFCLPFDLPGTGVNTLILSGITLAGLMAVARPNVLQSAVTLGLLFGLGLLGSILRIFFDADGGFMEIIALAPELVIVMLWFLWVYQKPRKPHPFKDMICWTVPKSIQQDCWWLELAKFKRSQFVLRIASIIFVFMALASFASHINKNSDTSIVVSSISNLEINQ